MKKRIAALLITAAMLSCSSYAAESETNMTYDELLEKYEQLQKDYTELEKKLAELTGSASHETESIESESISTEVHEYTPGMYKVGVDMEPGTYFLKASDSSASITVSSDANLRDITYIQIFNENLIAEVREGEYVQIKRAVASTYTGAETVDTDSAYFEAEIGVHLPAGEYKLQAADSGASYTIYSDNRFDDIVAINIFSDNCYVSVKDGQFLIVKRANIVK